MLISRWLWALVCAWDVAHYRLERRGERRVAWALDAVIFPSLILLAVGDTLVSWCWLQLTADRGARPAWVVAIAVVAGASVAIACSGIPVAPAPTPQQTMSPVAPVDVVRRGTQALLAAGFDVTVSDAAGGLVQAKRTRPKVGNAPDVRCGFPAGSMLGQALISTLTVAITATTSGTGSAVTITGHVEAAYPSLKDFWAHATNATDCVSTGSVERALAAAIAAP